MNSDPQESMNYHWKRKLYETIKSISDLEEHHIIWLGKSTQYVGSWEEYRMQLFDDFDAERFVSAAHWPAMKLPDVLHQPFQAFIVSIRSYGGKPTDKEILADEVWHKITKQAKEVIRLWDQSK